MTLTNKEVAIWISHLKQESKESYNAANDLFKSKHYHYSLFFCHLALEKIIKACFVFKNKKFAPPVHDLIFLIKRTAIPLQKDSLLQLAEINTFNIRTRYEDYKREFYRKATSEYAIKWLNITQKLLKFFAKYL